MKTQLMQDIQESATAPVPPSRRAAVRHRSQGVAVAAAGPLPERPEPPPVPPQTPVPPPADSAMPDWLVERLREDGEQARRQERRHRLQRRAIAWSIGTGAVAVLAAAGLWLHDESRVDGALGVVASTTSSVSIPASVAPAHAAPPVDTPTDAHTTDPVPVADAPVAASGIGGAAAAATRAAAAPEPPADTPPERPRSRATHVAVGSRPPAPAAASDPGARRRREETLMQCRAHGYDARQCARRACTMTRFGFACRG